MKELSSLQLKRGNTTAAVEAYSGPEGELVVDMSSKQIYTHTSGSQPRYKLPEVLGGNVIRPIILTPKHGMVDVSASPVITATDLSGSTPSGDPLTHAASIWTVYSDAALSQVVWTSGEDTVNLTSIDLDGKTTLGGLTQYWIQAEYVAEEGPRVKSMPVSFKTVKSTLPPTNFIEKIVSDDMANSDYFGSILELSDDGQVLVVGARGESDFEGAVYVFDLVNSSWVQRQKITNTGGTSTGSHVSISGDGKTIAIRNVTTLSTPGKVEIYRDTAGLFEYDATISGGVNYYFGTSFDLSVDGNVIAINGGGTATNGTTVNRIFEFTTTWNEVFVTTAYGNGADVTVISRDGKRAFFGSGSNIVYCTKETGSWVEHQINDVITSSLAYSDDLGVLFAGRGASYDVLKITVDDSGFIATEVAVSKPPTDTSNVYLSASKDGKILALGTPDNDGQYLQEGLVLVYQLTDSGYTLSGSVGASDPKADIYFGMSVSLDSLGEKLIVGSTATLNTNHGGAYYFTV